MTTPLVTVIVPTYNYGHYLPFCLESVVCQSYRDLEILVVDDASTDQTASIVDRIRDPRIRYERNSVRSGHTATFNRGLRSARGEYVTLLSADDFFAHRTSLAERVRVLDADPACDIVFGAAQQVDKSGQPVCATRRRKDTPTAETDFFKVALQRNLIELRPLVYPGSELVRRRCYEESGLYNEGLDAYEDFDLWLRMSHDHRVRYLPQILVAKRTHTASQTRSNLASGRAYRDLERFVTSTFERYPDATAKLERRRILASASLRVLAAELEGPGDLLRGRRRYLAILSDCWPVALGRVNMRVLAKVLYLLIQATIRSIPKWDVARPGINR